jgi:predicted DNA-binding transcriptional regulator AlpA
MNFAAVVEKLKACNTLLTVTEIADLSGVHFSTVNRWIKELDFPASTGCERTRLFAPLAVAAWFELQATEARDFLTVEQVCERIGVYPQTYIKWVKRGKAPSPRRRELGSARQLWDGKDIARFMHEQMADLPRPKSMALKKTNHKPTPREALKGSRPEKIRATA